ncbi:hypothetical protein BJF79_05910 [Actinomadura sp. CNU-125]|uniref:hypothetical protein n=1 Tax=Actinomadura sp. CNU-125 TaxID=1904961 RepID=UPI00095A6C46|nr:hypothetical protein [Actinomadura sp. CNU-125]OLT37743.1 hypothetical protein BJF79_05910 [Actinomadura sp. CNU-125]
MGITSESKGGVRVITMDFPPVNALPVAGWSDLAAAVDEAGRDEGTRVVVLRAEGRGFNSYRFEQGFTFELSLSGVVDRHRDAFVATGEPLKGGQARS